MIGAIFVNNGTTVDVYQVILDKMKIKKIQKSIDNYYGRGKKISKETNSLNLICDRDFLGNKVDIISKKYIGKKHIVDNRYPSYDGYINVYKYKYYAYHQHELSRLCDSLLNSNGTVSLSYNMKEIFDYKYKDNVDCKFLSDIIKTIKLTKINKKTFLIKLRNIINKINIKNKNINFEINFNNEAINIIDRAEKFNKNFYNNKSVQEVNQNNLSLGLNSKNKILMILPTKSMLDEKFKI